MARKSWHALRTLLASAQHSLAEPFSSYIPADGGSPIPVDLILLENQIDIDNLGVSVSTDEQLMLIQNAQLLHSIERQDRFIYRNTCYEVQRRAFDDGVRTGYVVRQV